MPCPLFIFQPFVLDSGAREATERSSRQWRGDEESMQAVGGPEQGNGERRLGTWQGEG